MTPLMSKDLTSAWQEGKKENCYLLLLHTVPKFQIFSKKNPHFFFKVFKVQKSSIFLRKKLKFLKKI